MKKFWQNFNRIVFREPPVWLLVLTYVLTPVFCVGSLLFLLTDFQQSPLQYLAYVVFALAAVLLAYAVYTIIKFIPDLKATILAKLNEYKFTRKLLQDFGFRTVIFAVFSFIFSIAYGIFNGVLGIQSSSIWFGALAAYYILLAFLRGGILTYQHGKFRNGTQENDKLLQLKKYRNCGLLLTLLHVALSAAIAQMIFSDKHFEYAGWTVFAHAAYAFFKITMAIINLFKATKHDDLTIRAIRCVNLTDATVSILALQTALLHTFSTGDMNISLFNTLTGGAVSIFCFSLGIYMVVHAKKIRNTYHEK